MRARLIDDNDQPTSLFGWLGIIAALFLPMLAGALLSGCTPMAAAGGGAVASASDRVVVEGGRALILANLAYQTVGTAAAIGIEQGVITGSTKVRVQAISQRVTDALTAGERAVLTGDKAASAAQALAGIDELCGLHPTLVRACAAVR